MYKFWCAYIILFNIKYIMQYFERVRQKILFLIILVSQHSLTIGLACKMFFSFFHCQSQFHDPTMTKGT